MQTLFSNARSWNVYITYMGDKEVKKCECVGHNQVRVGNKVLGELTAPLIDKLQNYFGIALRSNLSSVSLMRSAKLASFLLQHRIITMAIVTDLQKHGVNIKETEKTIAESC